MARAHSLLADARWSGADLQRLLTDELAAYADERVDLSGPPISLRPEATQAVSLALHELATNALKHGALSEEDGRLNISWSYTEPGASLTIHWQETGGPPIQGEPMRHGFGSVLLRQVVESQLGGALDLMWLKGGLFCHLSIPGDTWQASGVMETISLGVIKAPIQLPAHAGRRVLVVEDEALTAMALQQLLEDAGYIVLGPVGRVEDALDLLRSGPPDAAVLDVNLFGATVDPVAAMLEDMGVPFLFCTGYHSGATAGTRHPYAPVLGKPVNANNLLNAVSGLISHHV
jgi:CheY-like chemotaxis protein